jgi:hypothetical protein
MAEELRRQFDSPYYSVYVFEKGPIICREFIDYKSRYQLLKKDAASWSKEHLSEV